MPIPPPLPQYTKAEGSQDHVEREGFSILHQVSFISPSETNFPEITSGDWRVLSGITLLHLAFTFASDIIGCWFLLLDVCLGELYFCNSDLTKFGF